MADATIKHDGNEPDRAMGGVSMRMLAPYATQAPESAGRVHAEPACPMRTPYQRDRDSIVHATDFRWIKYKTKI